MAVPGSAADVRALFRSVMMHGYIEGIPERLAQGVDAWLRAHGGWFFDQQQLGYKEVREFEESIPIDDSPPFPPEVAPLLLRIHACEDLAEFHPHVYEIIVAMAMCSPEGRRALQARLSEAS